MEKNQLKPNTVYVLTTDAVNPKPDRRETHNVMARPVWSAQWRYIVELSESDDGEGRKSTWVAGAKAFGLHEGGEIGRIRCTDPGFDTLIAALVELRQLDSAAIIAKYRMDHVRATAFYKWLGDKLGPRVFDALLAEYDEAD